MIIYSRAREVAFVMGFEKLGSDDTISYVTNLKTSQTRAFSGPSSLIWEILETPQTSDQLIADVAEIYGVPHETVAEGVLSFLEELVAQGLALPNHEPEQ